MSFEWNQSERAEPEAAEILKGIALTHTHAHTTAEQIKRGMKREKWTNTKSVIEPFYLSSVHNVIRC